MANSSVPAPPPQSLIDEAVTRALAEDLGEAGDVTSAAVIRADARSAGVIAARKAGTVAGIEIAARAFSLMDAGISAVPTVIDGTRAAAGTELLRLEGSTRAILGAERVALNFLGRLSGIATATAEIVRAVAHTEARICCTRKTTPGLRGLEKYAVRCGGGVNHRFGLFDAVLIK
ncbi:MAG: nicotinate-nucleotide diphosphorylase (carboxylating), partial [Rhodobacteraceae bacterium]|nr:nicotinate-nucleotide diphosphorylase (carboxylating) [Paracoccaceae bacterium]